MLVVQNSKMSYFLTHHLKKKNFLNLLLYFSALLVIPLYPTGPLLPDLFLSLSVIIFIIISIRNNLKRFYFNKISLFFFVFFIYIISNSFFSLYPKVSLLSSVFYFRFYIFALAISYLLSIENNFKNTLYLVLKITITFVLIDTIYQYFAGTDFFNFEKQLHRLSGPFGEELIVGSFISKVLPVLISLEFFIRKKISLSLLGILFLSVITTFLSGERVSFFNIFLFSLIFLIFYQTKNKSKFVISSIFIILIPILVTLSFDKSRSDRMIKYPICAMNIDFFNFFNCAEKNVVWGGNKYEKTYQSSRIVIFSKAHEGHFRSAIKMFYDDPIFGKGIKMFRYHCSDPKFANENSCTSHPHNTLIQFLAELGFVGLIFLLIGIFGIYKVFFKLIFSKKKYQANNNQLSYILITFSIIQIFFIFLPSGQFFNNYLSILYYLPLGIFLNLNYNYHNNDK